MPLQKIKAQINSAKRFKTPIDVELAEELIKIIEAKEKEIEEIKNERKGKRGHWSF